MLEHSILMIIEKIIKYHMLQHNKTNIYEFHFQLV